LWFQQNDIPVGEADNKSINKCVAYIVICALKKNSRMGWQGVVAAGARLICRSIRSCGSSEEWHWSRELEEFRQ
jgi:hypothetical protein